MLMAVLAKRGNQQRDVVGGSKELTERASLDLIAQSINDRRLGAHEQQSRLLDLCCEFGVLREESVSRVNHGNAVLQRNLMRKSG
jgi:hypothetical protein